MNGEQRGGIGMRWRHVVVMAGLALTSADAAAQDVAIADFAGTWRGAEVRAGGDDAAPTLEPSALDVAIASESDGFRITWTGLVRQSDGALVPQSAEASFVLTDRPGIYAFEPTDSSLFSRLFADPATGNPLAGQTLLWARLAGATLTVYSLSVDAHGGFKLSRCARTLREGGLDVHCTHRLENDRVVTVEGRAEGGEG
jgi:hypothetical protein